MHLLTLVNLITNADENDYTDANAQANANAYSDNDGGWKA